MSFIDIIRSCTPNFRNSKLILKAFGQYDDSIEKSRSGVYSDNSVNRKLKRVGQKYGSKKEQQEPQKRTKQKEQSSPDKQKQFDEEKIKGYAKKATDKQLKLAAENHKDEKVKKIAQAEIEERNSKLSPKGKIDKKIEDLSDKYKDLMKELMDDKNIGNDELQQKLSKESQETARYLNRINKFKDSDLSKGVEDVNSLLGLKSEQEIKDFFGDGNVLGVTVEDKTVSVLTEDCYLERTFEEGIIHMDEFILNPEIDKSQGKGTDIFYNQVQSFKKLGFKELVTDAAKSSLYNGYYTWARLGYDFNNNEGKNQFKKMLQLFGNKELEKVQSLPELMSFKKGRDFWKKEGFAFLGTFRLTDNSESMFILDEYIKEKKNVKKEK